VPAVGEAGDDGGAECTRRVHRSSGEEEREEMACEEREADADGRERRGFVLLRTQHEYGQAKGCGYEHLNEYSLCVVHTRAGHRAIGIVDQRRSCKHTR
jgi:hypothetical protein